VLKALIHEDFGDGIMSDALLKGAEAHAVTAEREALAQPSERDEIVVVIGNLTLVRRHRATLPQTRGPVPSARGRGARRAGDART
jgi:hypothetical protein